MSHKSQKPIYTNTSPFLPPFTATVKDYGGIKKKLTVHKTRVRQSGLVGAFEHSPRDDNEGESPDRQQSGPVPSHAPPNVAAADESNKSPPDGEEENPQRLANNLSRARAVIFELALTNKWEWFVTLTLDPQKYNRTDLKKFHKDLSQFIRNYRARQGVNVKYLLIPEQHKDGAWHMHGLFMELPESKLRLLTLEEKLPRYIRYKLLSDQPVYEWEAYRKKFGFNDIEPIRNIEATSKYVTKYVTKAFNNNVIESGGHLYYASQRLNRATTIAKGQLQPDTNINFDFENEYVLTKWYDAADTPENLIEPDETIKRIRQKRQGSQQTEPEWEPMFDRETGEIFSTPFDDYDNSYQ